MRKSNSKETRRVKERRPEDCFFSRKSMRYHRQTMRDIDVSAFHLITDHSGNVRDCYKVESMQSDYPEGPRHLAIYYYDRDTLQLVSIEA